VGDFNSSVDGANLIDSFDLRRKSTVNAQHLAINDRSEWQVVEDFCAVLPGIGVSVLPIDFIEEPIHLSDLAALVIAPQKCDLVGILHLETQKILEGLHRVVSSIHEVTDEDVGACWDLPT